MIIPESFPHSYMDPDIDIIDILLNRVKIEMI